MRPRRSWLSSKKSTSAGRNRRRKIESKLARLRDQKSQLQEERSRVEVERARLETQLQNLSEQCSEQLQIALEQLADEVDLENVTLEGMLEPYTALKTRLEDFGPINMTALEGVSGERGTPHLPDRAAPRHRTIDRGYTTCDPGNQSSQPREVPQGL